MSPQPRRDGHLHRPTSGTCQSHSLNICLPRYVVTLCCTSAVCRLSHSLLWGAVLAVYLCSGSLTSLEFKLLLSVTVPVRRSGSTHHEHARSAHILSKAPLTACLRSEYKFGHDSVSSSYEMCSPNDTGLDCLLCVTQVVLMYFMMQTSDNDRPAGWKTVAIQCVASGVLSNRGCAQHVGVEAMPSACTRLCCADAVLTCCAGVLGFTLNHLVC